MLCGVELSNPNAAWAINRASASPTAPPTTAPGATSTVGYQVSGEGRAISIAYVGAGGVLRTEFSVTLPWSTEVDLDSATAETAMVTIITAGNEATCTLTVDGAQVQQRSGAFVTICANTG
ncbi:MmpS family transport accessory protein [Mycobacterium sp. 1274756.6]|uniref:MmpS family transport accessory protein n=1 Tax=Mycobacterium sp. 1274756.6 TaxID=1834076 RepID=UPI001E4AD6B9|nr:MmpS family transport accessory protein [Mycobacterium sp. 1274756.6]